MVRDKRIGVDGGHIGARNFFNLQTRARAREMLFELRRCPTAIDDSRTGARATPSFGAPPANYIVSLSKSAFIAFLET